MQRVVSASMVAQKVTTSNRSQGPSTKQSFCRREKRAKRRDRNDLDCTMRVLVHMYRAVEQDAVHNGVEL